MSLTYVLLSTKYSAECNLKEESRQIQRNSKITRMKKMIILYTYSLYICIFVSYCNTEDICTINISTTNLTGHDVDRWQSEHHVKSRISQYL